MPKPVKVSFKIRDIYTSDPKQLLSRIQRLNPELKTKEWRVLHHHAGLQTSCWIFEIDIEALEAIKQAKFQASSGLDRGTFKVLCNPNEKKSYAEGTVATTSSEFMESNDTFDINSLPEEIILKIFGYLKQNQLGQIACVCRSWNMLTQSPVLWKEINVKLYHYCGNQNTVANCFVKTLPPCVNHIRLDFRVCSDWTEPLNFEQFSVELQKRCPHLKSLILECAKLSDSLPSITNLCTQYLEELRILVFHFTYFPNSPARGECDRISKIEILDLSKCDFGENNKPLFSKMASLKQLHLRNANVDDSWFEDDTSFLSQLHVLDLGEIDIGVKVLLAINNHGLNLKELYLCGTDLENDDLTSSAVPHLETICLRFCDFVSREIIVSLVQTCQSLQNIYVDEHVAKSYIAHPFVIANRSKLDIVKFIDWCNHEKNYFCNKT